MNKEAIEIGVKRPRQTSFYDRHIRQKRIRLDMIICVFLMVFIQIGIYFVVRYMTTPKSSNTYPYNDSYDYGLYNDTYATPMYSYAPSSAPSGGYYGYSYRPVVDIGVSGDTSNVNRLVNEIKNTMANKHEKNKVLSSGDLEIIEDYGKNLMNSQPSKASKTTTTATDAQPDEIIRNPKNNDNMNTNINIMNDINNIYLYDDAKLLRAGPKSNDNMNMNQLIYQFNPKEYDSIDINLHNYGVRLRSNITVRQAPPTSTNKNIIIIFNEISKFRSSLYVDGNYNDGSFHFQIFERNRQFSSYSGGADVDITIEVIFPSHLEAYSLLSIQHHIGYTHFDKSLENINFNAVGVYTDYGAFVAEHLKTQKLTATFFNGYLNGYFEVSKNIGVATYYGKMKPTIRCMSNDVHILAVARYGTVNAYVDKNTYEGAIDIQSNDALPIIYDTDLSSFSESTMKPSPAAIRLGTRYKSLTSDNHLLVSAGKNATLTFVEVNP